MGENENKDLQNTETTDNEINELDGDSLTGVAGGVAGDEVTKISGKLKEVLPISVVAYGHPGMIGLKYGFPSGRPDLIVISIRKKISELEEKLKDPNLSPEERKRIEGLLKRYKSGGLSSGNK